jgi:hypothetical protein
MFVIKPLKILDLVFELRQQIDLSLEKPTARLGAPLQIANWWDNYRHNTWKEPSQLVWKQIEQLQDFLLECRKYLLTKYFKNEEQRQ